MKPRKTVIGAAALSLAVAGSLAGANSARADGGEECLTCPSLRGPVAALTSVTQKFNSDSAFEKVTWKFDSPFWKLETPLAKIYTILSKFGD